MPRDLDPSDDILSALLPLHVRLDRRGRVLRLGPTMERLAKGRLTRGASLFDALEVRRPGRITDMDSLMAAAGKRLFMSFRQPPLRNLKAHIVPCGTEAVLDCSLALSAMSCFRSTGLTASDFAPTDATVDVLYLLEARKIAKSEFWRFVQRMQGARSRAETAAHTDTLTGLRNRRALQDVLEDVRASRQPFAICQVDLDYFKQINDTHGHATGDAVLKIASKRLVGAVRATDTVARIGGDEFTLVLPGLVDRDLLSQIGERIVTDLERPITAEGHECRVSGSVGISLSTDYDPVDPAQMIEDADRSLYRSKSAGRACCTIHRPAHAAGGAEPPRAAS